MIKNLLFSVFLLLLYSSAFTQTNSPVNTPVTVTDTLVYPYLKEFTFSATKDSFFVDAMVGNVRTAAQAYTAPAGVKVKGVQFWGGAYTNNPNHRQSIPVELSLWSVDNMNMPVAMLASTTVNVNSGDAFYHALFSSPVAVTSNYAVAVRSVLNDTVQVITNNAGNTWASKSYGEGLAWRKFGSGTWNTNMAFFGQDLEYMIFPIVEYTVNASYTTDGEALIGVQETFTNIPTDMFSDRMYNLYAFDEHWGYSGVDKRYIWNYGDGVSDTTKNGAHTYSAAGDVDVTLSAEMLGYYSSGTATSKTTVKVLSPISTNANLSALTVSSGELSPTFSSATTSYTVSVANNITSVKVTPTVADTKSSVQVEGVTVNSGNASADISLVQGSNTITTVVTAEDGTTTKTYTLTVIRRATQNITFNALNAKTYGDADFDASATASSSLGVTYTSSNTHVATVVSNKIHIVGAGTTTITANQSGDNSYDAAASATQDLVVNKKDITLSLNASPVITKVYDGATTATLAAANYSLNNVISGDDVTVSGSAYYDDKDVAAGKTITVNNFVLGGNKKDSYNLTTSAETTTGDITVKDITLTVNASPAITKVYDGTTKALLSPANYTLIGTETMDEVSVSGTAIYDNKDVASGKTVTVTNFILAGAQKGNYHLITNSEVTTGIITPKEITVSLNAVPAITRVYNGTVSANLAAANYTLHGLEGNDLVTVSGTATYDDKNTGISKTVTAKSFVLAGTHKTNYTVSSVSAATTGSITAKDITLSLTASPAIVKEYDGNTAANLDAQNYVLHGVETNDLISVKGTANFNTKDVGTGKTITVNNFALAGTDKVNYNLTTLSTTTTGSVSKKELTVKADDKQKYQGTANPALTVSYIGFASGETKSDLLIEAAATTTAVLNSGLGTYTIVPAGASSNNYSFNYINGTLTIVPGHPTSISLAAAIVYENSPAQTLAGTLSSTSDDPSATFTYSLAPGTGDTDNGKFTIVNNQIKTLGALNFEQQASYKVRVRSTTQHQLSLDKELTIAISNVNEQPTLANINNSTICYTSAEQAIALTGITAGEDAGQSTVVSVSTTNNLMFKSLTVNQAVNGNATLSYRLNDGSVGSAVINVMVTDNGGTANSGVNTILKSFTLNVNPLPVIAIASSKGNSLSKGETTLLKADVTVGNTGLSYSWSNANGILSGQNTVNLEIRPSETTTYTLIVTNVNGCVSTQSITIEVLADYQVVSGTNIMTPNGDGVNDRLIIKNLDMYPKNEVKIFDRAGRLLYSQQNYTDQWDGTLNGSPLAEDTYYYVVDFGPAIPRIKGFITIVKEN